VGLATRYYFLSECCCLKFAVLYLFGALSDERTGSIPERYIYRDLFLEVGGELEYHHRSPASRKRRRKGNPVPGGITGPPCSWGI
jgi:hypothetical protein